jgi:hypothetical protein
VAGYFVDSSALVKRYVQAVGASWVRSLTHRASANQIYQTGGLDPIILVSSDQALNAAATAEGLTVADPNAHP